MASQLRRSMKIQRFNNYPGWKTDRRNNYRNHVKINATLSTTRISMQYLLHKRDDLNAHHFFPLINISKAVLTQREK